MKLTKKTRTQIRSNKFIFIVLLLCITGMLAWLSQQHRIQFDWTKSQRNSLSESSIHLLKRLQNTVNANIYIQDDPTVAAAVNEILSRYQRETKHFKCRIFNPDLDIEQAKLDKITQHGQMVLKYQDRKENIASLSELAISSAIQRLLRGTQRKLVFLTGHGEHDTTDSTNTGYSQLVTQLHKSGLTLIQHNLLKAPLPDDTDVLIIAAPGQPVLPGELEHIKKYIQSGGNLLWMIDPDSVSSELYGLSDIADILHIHFLKGMVVDNNVNLRQTLRITHPAMIPVLDYHPHAITQSLNYNTLFPLSTGITIVENNEWQQNIIAQSMAQSWSETSSLNDKIIFSTADGDIPGPITIVQALERKLENDNNKASQRIIIAGDSDFLSNSYIGTGANLSLGTNILNWLAGDNDLFAIDVKAAPDTRLYLSDIATLLISLGFLIVLPVILLIAGILIWIKRRKR